MGLQGKACQIRCMVETETPEALAIDRVLQWVASAGMVSSVFVTTSAILSSPIWHGSPDAERGATVAFSIAKACQNFGGKVFAPCRHRQTADAKPLGDGDVGQPIGRTKDNLQPHGVRTGYLPAPRPRFQFAPFPFAKLDHVRRCPSHHGLPSQSTWRRESLRNRRG